MPNTRPIQPDYTLVIKSFGTNFAPGTTVAVLENAVNIGYADYLNDVPQMFFTLQQNDKRLNSLATLAAYGDGHALLYRNDHLGNHDLVFGGFFAQEIDEREGDVVFYNYGYLAALYWGWLPWDQEWTSQTVGQVVSDILTWSKGGSENGFNGPTYSMLKWITTGTIESPVTTSGGATAITMPLYKGPYKRPLFALRELAAFSQSDTTNRVWFEITPAGVFNFWKNKGTDQTADQWLWPAHDVIGFHRFRRPVFRRNNLQAVGSNARDAALFAAQNSSADQAAHGFRGDSLYLQWTRDATELDRISRNRLTRALKGDKELQLILAPGVVPPLGATGGFNKGDTVKVSIDRGITQMSKEQKILVGQQVIWVNNREYVRPVLQDLPS